MSSDRLDWSHGAPGLMPGRVVFPVYPAGHMKVFILLIAMLLGACGKGVPTDPGGTGIGREIRRIGGDAQSGIVGTQLSEPLVVAVTRSSDGAAEPGVAVTFTAQGGGTVSAASVITDAAGRAETRWTLGPAANDSQAVRATLSGAAGSPVIFTALARAGAAVRLTSDSASNNQRAGPGAALPLPLQVRALDALGNPVAGVVVEWRLLEGGGVLLPSTSSTDAEGRATTRWTLGSGGPQRVEATATGLQPTILTAQLVDLAITGVSVDTLVPGTRVTITGRGFGNSVGTTSLQLGEQTVPLISVTPTSMLFDVPAVCRPRGLVELRVTVSGAAAAAVTRPFRPLSTVSLRTGEMQLLRDPSAFCLQFAETTADEAYLVGVLNAAESPLDLQSVSLNARSTLPGVVAGWDLPPARRAPTQLRAAASAVDPAGRPAARRHARHALEERILRQRDAETARGRGLPRGEQRQTALAGAALRVLPTSPLVGDTVPVQYGFGGCTPTATIRAVVRQVGARSLWLEDIANPAGGFSLADYQQLSATFDEQIYAVDTENWGQPTDLDGNGRIGIVVTKRVNDEGGILGFVTAADFFPPAGASPCPRSNFGEIYYAIAPDPGNPDPSARYTREEALADAPLLIAHEFTHIIQLGRRLGAQQPALAFWESEGQATLSEQLNGFAAEGLAARGNYGLGVAFSAFDPARIAWYADTFTDLAQLYGFACFQRAADGSCVQFGKVPGAPQECSFLATTVAPTFSGMGAPCLGGRTAYGAPSLLLRYVADQYGPAYAGGTPALLRDLVGSGASGLANLTGRISQPADQLLAEFWAALYLDDRIAAAPPRLQFATWNLTDIFEGTAVSSTGAVRSLRPETRLLPMERSFSEFTDQVAVRGGSAALLRLEGAGRPGVALQAAATDRVSPLGAQMRIWIVRLR